MSIDYYNTRIRQAISDELVKCNKRQQEYLVEHNVVLARLASEKDWDQAREICLNIADEMEDTK